MKLRPLLIVMLAFVSQLPAADSVSLTGPYILTPADSLAKNHEHPPASARPWVYWIWKNGNATGYGITADREARHRNGIGGVLIRDVFESFAAPRGAAGFMNPGWRNLFEFSVQEAARFGLEINMANGPGWCGSSGPWITPELSKQMLVSASIPVIGPTSFAGLLPQSNTGVEGNGKNCGIAWRSPFQVDITGTLRSDENELKIQVANLWPNHMIGAGAWPEEKRVAWSSWEPFKAGTPLIKSGLMGPVVLHAGRRNG